MTDVANDEDDATDEAAPVGKQRDVLLAVTDAAMSPPQRAFVSDWMASHGDDSIRAIGSFSLIASLVMLVLLYLVAGPGRVYLLPGHIAVSIFLAGWYVAMRRGARYLSLLLFVPQILLVAIYSYVFYLGIKGRGPDAMLAGVLLFTLLQVCMRLTPFTKMKHVLVQFGLSWAVGMWPMWGQPTAGRWSAMLFFSLAFSVGCEHLRLRRIRGEALMEWDARERIRAGERRSHDKQLEVARQIQDSYAPPPTQLMTDRVSVHTYQQKFHPLGGDWVGVRELSEGRVAVLVADASGKGVQAALVTHALQSLWASASLEAEFDPVAWLERVNKTLLILGRSQLQTMTIGLAVISAHEIVYYSAGHVPCFVAVTGEAGRYVKALKARGNMVGVVENLELEPARLDLSRYAEVNVLLGSDGIFHSANQTRAPFILSTIDKLARHDEATVMKIDSGDDKLLIWVRREAA